MFSHTYNNGGYDNSYALKIDASGNCYVAGVSSGVGTGNDYIIIKLSSTGTQLWTKRFDSGVNGVDVAYDLCFDSQGYVYVTGQSNLSNGTSNIVALKLQASHDLN